MAKIHELKCEEPHFTDVAEGRKLFEVRFDDRDYRTGDVLELISLATGERVRAEVLHILRGGRHGAFGVWSAYVIMSIKLKENYHHAAIAKAD